MPWESATANLIIVESGAEIPSDIFARQECSVHAVIRMGPGESLSALLLRARRCIREFESSKVHLTDVLVVTKKRALETDLTALEELGRSLLELGDNAQASLTFLSDTGDARLAAKLLAVVGTVLEGTIGHRVRLAVRPGSRRDFAEVSATA
jgi:broad specificity phosphatase PhoE